MAKRTKKELRDAKARVDNLAEVVKEFPKGLDLNHLRLANVHRSEDRHGFDHPLSVWSVAEWTNALCGEAGEAANVAKKLLRIRKETNGNKRGESQRKLLHKLAKEIADVVIYADLVLASEGISLSDTVVDVYNAKSAEIGYGYRLITSHLRGVDKVHPRKGAWEC